VLTIATFDISIEGLEGEGGKKKNTESLHERHFLICIDYQIDKFQISNCTVWSRFIWMADHPAEPEEEKK
jgi:hypothetical protein